MKNAITKIQTFIIILVLFFSAKNFAVPTTDSEFVLTLPSTETKKHKKRMRKQSTKTKKVAKKSYHSYRDMPYEELAAAKDQLLAKQQFDTAIKYLEQMMKIDGNIERIGTHLVEMGDLLFELGKYSKAAILYTEFSMLYPGDNKVEYALYRGIVSSFNCTLSIDRDQTKTEETILLAATFLEHKHFTTYAAEVENILSQCYQKLIENEFYISAFYLKRGNITAVEKRLATMRDLWLRKLPAIEMQLLTFEADLALKKGDTVMALNKQSEIAQKQSVLFENSGDESMTCAQTRTNRRMRDRF